MAVNSGKGFDMNAVNTIREAELAIAGLSVTERRQLLKSLSSNFTSRFAAIEKNENIMAGAACIRGTRIPVWLLEQARQQGVSEADLLNNYPGLSAEDLVNAWDYAGVNRDEIEAQIAAMSVKNNAILCGREFPACRCGRVATVEPRRFDGFRRWAGEQGPYRTIKF